MTPPETEGAAPPRGALCLLGLAPLLGALLGGGAVWPSFTELLGVAVLGALGVLSWRRLLRGPPPAVTELALMLLAAVAVALATLVGGRAAAIHTPSEPACRRLALASALVGFVALGALACWPRLLGWWGEGPRGEGQPDGQAEGLRGRLVVVGAWSLVHLPTFLAFPALLQPDSSTNAVEPALFQTGVLPPHHPPLYPQLIHVASGVAPLQEALALVVALQHLALLLVALLIRDLVQRLGGRAWLATTAGVCVAVDPTLLAYSQLVMSESLATSWVALALIALVRADRSQRPDLLLVAAGTCAALATLTRQVTQAWFLLAASWLVLAGRVRPRPRALVAFALPALIPVALVVAHNWVFQGRASVTAAWGRSLTARLVLDMPRASEPSDDVELERARLLIWRDRQAAVWGPIHQAMRDELGWDDERIGRAVQRLFAEQVRSHPGVFLSSTWDGWLGILCGSERLEDLVAYHDRVRPHALQGWHVLRDTGGAPRWVRPLQALAFTHTWPVLLLAAASPLLGLGRSRRVALLAVATAAYLLAVPALLEQPLPRYRQPAVPCILLAAALGAAGIQERWRSRRANRVPAPT